MTSVPEQRGTGSHTPIADMYAYNQRLVKAIRSTGLLATVEVCREAPAEAILAVAAGQQAACIVLATHGRSGLRRWTLSSVADKVLHAAPMPVLVVRTSQDVAQREVRFQHILVPLDGSPLAQQALPLAADLAQRAGAEITLAHAIAPITDVLTSTTLTGLPPVQLDGVYQALHAQALRALSEAADQLRTQGLQVSTVIDSSPAADLIIAAANRCHADVIVMATHGRSGFSRWALGSTTEKILHAAPIPVLLVRATHHAS